MGVASTEVSRYGGESELVFEGKINNIDIQTARIDIQSIAAGGVSLL